MNFNTIFDIAVFRESVRMELRKTLASLSADDLAKCEHDGGWSVAYIAEHLAITEGGIAKIIERLIGKSRELNLPVTNAPVISDRLRTIFETAVDQKAEAPEMVRPTGSMTIEQTLASLDDTSAGLDVLMADAHEYDTTGPTFPHPFFGELTAPEWLAVLGFHESRHLAQIKRCLGTVNKSSEK